MNKLVKAIKDPRLAASIFWIRISRLIVSDKVYLKVLYRLRVGKKLNLKHPKGFNEKLQWLKLYYRNPLQTVLVDKYQAKKFVAERIGDNFIIPTIGVWDSFDDIDFTQLPNQFVLKTTHDQGGVVICTNKDTFDLSYARRKLNFHLKRKHFYLTREWPYRDVVPRIIAEEYKVDESGDELKDYKFFCFDGEVKAMYIATERQSGDVKFDFYDAEFNYLDFRQVHKQRGRSLKKPTNFDQMLNLAQILSLGFPHVRVDFYNINGRIYFGEFTFFHHGGIVGFNPDSWDYVFGSWLTLPNLR